MEFGSEFVIGAPVGARKLNEGGSTLCSAVGENFNTRKDGLCILRITDTAANQVYKRAAFSMQGQREVSFLIVFSITDPHSFEEAKSTYKHCCNAWNVLHVPALLCANKCDSERERAVSEVEVLSWANTFNVPVLSTSARQRINIDEAFIKLLQVSQRTGFDYNIFILGAGGVGKSAICMQFTRNYFPVEHHRTVENQDQITRQIIVSDLPSHFQVPHFPYSYISPPRKVPRVNRLEQKNFHAIFTPAHSEPRLPPSTTQQPSLPSYEEVTEQRRKDIWITKEDTNVVMFNLGSLVPGAIKTEPLTFPPPMCRGCSAAIASHLSCPFCGLQHPYKPREWKGPPAAVEYTLVRGIKSSLSTPHLVSDADHHGLVVFCIDVSMSLFTKQDVKLSQPKNISWEDFQHGDGFGKLSRQPPQPFRYVHRLKDIQNVIRDHLDHLASYFPARKVVIITFGESVQCFFGAIRTPSIDTSGIKTIQDGMKAARSVFPEDWDSHSGVLPQDIEKPVPKESGDLTALGTALAIALGLAREHRHEVGAMTEIFLYTDGESNIGIGSTMSADTLSEDSNLHGHSFYSQVGEIAVRQRARINVIGVAEGSGEFGIVTKAAQISGGIVTTTRSAEWQGQVRMAMQPRILATDVTIRLYAAKGWHFASDLRPGIVVDANTLTYTLSQVYEGTTVGFEIFPADEKTTIDGLKQFQAQITHTSPSTGDTKVQILSRMLPATHDRAQAEATVDVGLVGAYALQQISFAANQILTNNDSRSETKLQIGMLRDKLYETYKMLTRGANRPAQKEELDNFTRHGVKLDSELERLLNDESDAVKHRAVRTFTSVAKLSRDMLSAENGR